MAHVSIIGTGNMGQAIAASSTKGGHTVELIGHSDADKPVTGEVVVLAVPYPAVADVLAERGGQLAGKVVVDITNPLDFADLRLPDRPGRRLGRRRDRRGTARVPRAQGLQHHLRRAPSPRAPSARCRPRS